MAERPPDPKDVRVSMVDKGWSESPPLVRDAPPPPPLPKKGDFPPPPPLPGSEPPPAPVSSPVSSPASSKDDITRDETPDISEIEESEPPTESAPRELPLYEDSTREFLVTRVDDQMQARAIAMNAEGEELAGEKTVVAQTIPHTPPAPAPAPRPASAEPFPAARSSPSAAAQPPPPPPLPKARSSPSAASSPKAASAPSSASAPATSAPAASAPAAAAPAPPPLPRPIVPQMAPAAAAPKTDASFPPKVRTAAWPIQVTAPVAPVAPAESSKAAAPAAPVASAVAPPSSSSAPTPPVAPVSPAATSSPSAVLSSGPTFPLSEVPTRRDPTVPTELESQKRILDASIPSSITMVDRYGPVSTVRDALLGRVRVVNRAIPLWAVLAPVLVLTAMLAALFVGVVGGSSSPSSEPSPAASGSAEPADPSRASTPATGEKTGNLSLLDRAAAGDPAALSSLEQKKPKDLGTDEAIALARGRVARDVAAVKKLRERLAADPGLAKDKKIIADLLRFAHGRETSHDALATMAALPGPLSADLVYEVWTGTAERSDATELARSILLGKDVRPKASPALSVALELREATEAMKCDESKALLSKAIEQGDKRALVPINRVARKTGCGPNKKQDCYPCLRDGDLIKRAFNAVRVRREPEIVR